MRALSFVVLFLAAIYSGYWVVGSRTVTRTANDTVTQLQDQGWDIEVAKIATRGFPSRFDTTATQVSVAPPTGEWRYDAPFVQALALSYAPNDVIAVLPQVQTLTLAGQQVTITSKQLRASTGVAASTDLRFKGFTAEGDTINAQSSYGGELSIAQLLVAMRPAVTGPSNYDLFAELKEIGLKDPANPDAAGYVLDNLTLESEMTLNVPLDRHSFASETDVVPTAVTVSKAQIIFDELVLNASGTLDIPAGVPEGQLDVTIQNWRVLFDLLVQEGAIPSDVAMTYIGVAAAMSGSDGAIDLPLIFRNGSMSLGPLPLGPAPRFY